jgi:hypothetical protein
MSKKMNYYYYPLCSKDFTFENIFASESVSPPAFYKKRGFGFDFFYKIPKIHTDNAIILFNEPPKYETREAAQNHAKFILQITEDTLDQDSMIAIDENIIAYPKTIHFTRQNVQFLFFSEKEKNIARMKSETSLPTKDLKKYEANFEIISESVCKEFNIPELEKINFETESFLKEISFDRRYNNFKGLIYGIVCGWFCEKSKEELQLLKSFQELTNCFAELKNRLQNNKTYVSRYQRNFTSSPITSGGVLNKLEETLRYSQDLFKAVHPVEEVSIDELVKFLQNTYINILSTPEKAIDYLNYKLLDDATLGTDNLNKIKSQYIKLEGKKGNNPGLLFEELRDHFNSYARASMFNEEHSKVIKERSNDGFKKTLFELTQFAESGFLDKGNSKKVSLEGLQFDVATNEIKITSDFKNLNESFKKDYIEIVNNILRYSKFGKGDASRVQLLQIIENVGDSSGKRRGKETHLYQYLNNEIHEYNFENIGSVTMKNFVAFIFNPDSLEKLELFLNAKDINEKWIAYSFWCAYNGFANTSRNFTKPVFEKGEQRLQDYLDTFLVSARTCSVKDVLIPNDEMIANKDEDSDLKKRKHFYFEYVQGKFKLSYEDFVSAISQEKKDAMITELVLKNNLGKREAGKLIIKYIDFNKKPFLF